jgi:anti-sigma factor RsiW
MTGNEFPISEDDLQAFIDGRLDDERRTAVETHLAAHSELTDRIAAERRHRTLLRGRLEAKFAEPIPARLRVANLRAARRGRWIGSTRAAAAALVIFGVGAVAGWVANGLAPSRLPPVATAGVTQNAVAAFRTYVVEVAHPVEVGVQHEAHLLQWLSKRRCA